MSKTELIVCVSINNKWQQKKGKKKKKSLTVSQNPHTTELWAHLNRFYRMSHPMPEANKHTSYQIK